MSFLQGTMPYLNLGSGDIVTDDQSTSLKGAGKTLALCSFQSRESFDEAHTLVSLISFFEPISHGVATTHQG